MGCCCPKPPSSAGQQEFHPKPQDLSEPWFIKSHTAADMLGKGPLQPEVPLFSSSTTDDPAPKSGTSQCISGDLESAELFALLQKLGFDEYEDTLAAGGILSVDQLYARVDSDGGRVDPAAVLPAGLPLSVRKKIAAAIMDDAWREAWEDEWREKKEQQDSLDERWRPIHFAAWQGRDRQLRMLLNSPAMLVDLDLQGPDGKTALHLSAGHGHRTCVDMLIQAGAKTLIEDSQGRTASDYAEQYGEKAIATVIRKVKRSSMLKVDETRALSPTERLYASMSAVDSDAEDDDPNAIRPPKNVPNFDNM